MYNSKLVFDLFFCVGIDYVKHTESSTNTVPLYMPKALYQAIDKVEFRTMQQWREAP